MTLLVSFAGRFAAGLCVGLLLTPSTLVPPGFYRVNMLVVMGLCTLGALAAAGAAPDGVTALLAVAAAGGWLASIAWGTGRSAAGMRLVAATGTAAAAATAWLALVPAGTGGPVAARTVAAGTGLAALASGLLVGLVVHAMLLGHWYLNAPGMRVDVLAGMIRWALVAVAAVGVIAATALPWLVPACGDPALATLAVLRWVAGLAGLPALLVMALRTLDIPNTQSATGILYVACLAAIVGELASQLLETHLHRPV